MGDGIRLAVAGARGPVGEAVLELLAERGFPLSELVLLEAGEGAGGSVRFAGRGVRVLGLEGYDFSGVDLVLFAAGPEAAAACVPRALAAGCAVVDGSGAYAGEPGVPLVAAQANAEALGGFAGGVVAAADPLVALLATALAPLAREAGIERVNVASYESVSADGPAAVEELARQITHLLNFRDVQPKIYPVQIAFNVFPRSGKPGTAGDSEGEERTAEQLTRIFGSEVGVNVTAVRVPVFYGHSAALQVQLVQPMELDAVRQALEDAPGVEVAEETDGHPTPVTDGSTGGPVRIGRIRLDRSQPRGLNLWLVGDNLRTGAALNSVQIAEILVKDYLRPEVSEHS